MSEFQIKMVDEDINIIITHDGIEVVNVTTSDIDEIKDAVIGYEYELSEMISGASNDNN